MFLALLAPFARHFILLAAILTSSPSRGALSFPPTWNRVIYIKPLIKSSSLVVMILDSPANSGHLTHPPVSRPYITFSIPDGVAAVAPVGDDEA